MPAEPAAPAMPGMPGMPGEPAMPAESAQPAVPGQQTIIDNTLPLPPPGQSSYPLCSATLQDQCINPSEAPRSMRQTKRRSGKRG